MNKIMLFAAVAAMFLATGCYVIPDSGNEIENGDHHHVIITDDVVTDDTVTDETVTDNTVTDDTIVDEETEADNTADVDMVDETPDIDTVDVDSTEVDETPDADNDFDNVYPTASLSGPIGIDESADGIVKVSIDKTSEIGLVFYVGFNSGSDTAVYGTDYSVTMTDNKLVIPAGSKEASFTLRNLENAHVDGNRTVTVQLYLGTNGVNLGNSQVVILLYDNDIVDTGTFAFDTTSAEVVEGGNKFCFNVTRTGGTNTLPASVVVRKTSGDLGDIEMEPLAPGNYTDGFVLNFAAGEAFRQMCVRALTDGIAEVDEAIEFKLESPSAQSKLDPERNTFEVTVKDAVATEVIVDAGNSSCKEFVMAIGKAMKCYAYGLRTEVFNTSTDKKYRLKGTCALDCPELASGDYFTCNGDGVDQSGFCELPLGGKGCTHNGDCR